MGLDAMFEIRDRCEKQDYKTYLEVMDINRNDEIDYEIDRLLKE